METIRAILSLSRLVLAVVASSALAISSGTLVELADDRLKWDTWQAWLLPLTIDVLAGYGVSQWLSGSVTEQAKRWGRGVAIACLLVSIAGNTIEHTMAANGWVPPREVLIMMAVVWGSIPPLAFFVAVHMYSLTKSPIRRRKAKVTEPVATESSPRPAAKSGGPVLGPRPVVIGEVATKREGTDEEILAWAAAQSGRVSKRMLQAHWKLGSTRASRLAKQAA